MNPIAGSQLAGFKAVKCFCYEVLQRECHRAGDSALRPFHRQGPAMYNPKAALVTLLLRSRGWRPPAPDENFFPVVLLLTFLLRLPGKSFHLSPPGPLIFAACSFSLSFMPVKPSRDAAAVFLSQIGQPGCGRCPDRDMRGGFHPSFHNKAIISPKMCCPIFPVSMAL